MVFVIIGTSYHIDVCSRVHLFIFSDQFVSWLTAELDVIHPEGDATTGLPGTNCRDSGCKWQKKQLICLEKWVKVVKHHPSLIYVDVNKPHLAFNPLFIAIVAVPARRYHGVTVEHRHYDGNNVDNTPHIDKCLRRRSHS